VTTILFIFIIALGFSLFLTPVAKKIGVRFGAMDVPDERKSHVKPIPRTGGIAIFFSFLIALAASKLFHTQVSDQLTFCHESQCLIYGALICFGIGMIDDFKRLGPTIKVVFQIAAASIAFWGGIRIEGLLLGAFSINFLPVSYLVTVFWFVFLINAVNLVDGLDGLAGGIVFFASLVMVILSLISEDFSTCILFTALAGSVLGFMRYNFNPASVFLGDGGAYFLGYAIASFSIAGSVKSQMGAALLIPLLALGVPLFDAILAPIRRFIVGEKMFHPDKSHIHHRLVEMGASTRNVVWLFYLITIGLCLVAVAVVNIRDERAGLFLILLGAAAVFFVRKLGYFEYFASDKLYGWFKDVTDEAGLTNERRSFLNLQIELSNSKNSEELWHNITKALDRLLFDRAEIELNNGFSPEKIEQKDCFSWSRNEECKCEEGDEGCLLKLDLPLIDNGMKNFGNLKLIKDLRQNDISHYTLRRVEHLRRTLIGTLNKLEKAGVRRESVRR